MENRNSNEPQDERMLIDKLFIAGYIMLVLFALGSCVVSTRSKLERAAAFQEAKIGVFVEHVPKQEEYNKYFNNYNKNYEATETGNQVEKTLEFDEKYSEYVDRYLSNYVSNVNGKILSTDEVTEYNKKVGGLFSIPETKKVYTISVPANAPLSDNLYQSLLWHIGYDNRRK